MRAAVADWPKMRALIAEDADRVADHEGAALLRWLGDGMLTQLGHVDAPPRRHASASGSASAARARASCSPTRRYERAFAWFDDASAARAPLIIKANRLSRVHRRVPLDLFIVPLVEDGKVAALSVHAGIWTSAALADPARAACRVLRAPPRRDRRRARLRARRP